MNIPYFLRPIVVFIRWVKSRKFRKEISSNGGSIWGYVDFRIWGKGSIQFGKNNRIYGLGIDLPGQTKIHVSDGAVLTVGNMVGISQSSIYCNKKITIGNYVNIGAGCLIMDSNFHCLDWQTRRDWIRDHKECKSAPITIEDDVFVGARSIVCKGVTIGARSVIAAGSVVIKDIPTDCIAGGNPCKVIKRINNENHQ